ncbi:alcohol dehydrogenase catalytic domain-containing protein [[Actinomadura] parvosata]|uniref:alcohol dehydrogenase catalytic domain-containing protein n=1 Tax=[Actinomadura] parvosata TaxID=1955412 RepID=UPI00406CE43E
MGRIVVTGATGTVGRLAVALLREAGAEVVTLSGKDGDLRDPGTLPPLDGVTSVLLVWPFATADGAREVVRALAGRHVVYLSSAARRASEREVERLVEAAGTWTFLRPHAFAANALRWARQVRAGVVRGAYGAAGQPVVHERDVAAVAVRALLDAGHHGAAYTLTGPETLSQADQVRIVSEVTGIPVRWEEQAPELARTALLAGGWPAGAVEEVLRAQAELARRPAPVTPAVEDVTKAAPRTFREWVEEHADAFRSVPRRSRAAERSMRAARIHEFGDASVIRVEEVPVPRPGPGEVLVEVAATAFNPSEVGLRSGLLPEVFRASLPHTLGWDVSGTVVETGAGVSDLAVGDRVFGMVDGAAAEYVAAPAAVLATAPRSIPLADAAAVPVAGLTAWQAVHEHARVEPGRRVLVNGAGGGVGTFAVQLAKLAGAHVIATASPRSAAAVRRLGADEVIDYTTTPLPTDVDVLLNLIPATNQPTTNDPATNTPATRGRTVVSIAGGAGHFVMRYDPAQLTALAALIDEGRLTVEIAESHPLPALPRIHRRAEAGDLRGKVTVLMG